MKQLSGAVSGYRVNMVTVILDVEANIGVGVTIGQGDVVKDVALTSSVKAGLGGLVEGELSGRLATQGGPSVEATGSTILDNLPPIGK